MDLNEFKAWFDGYTEAGGKDIGRIKKKLDKVYPSQGMDWWTVPQIVPSPWWPYNIPNTYPWRVTTGTTTNILASNTSDDSVTTSSTVIL
jgi:hypothetical protein